MLYYGVLKYVALMFKLVAVRIRLLNHRKAHMSAALLERELDVIVRSHYMALECADILEEIISPVILIHFVGCVITWCLLILYITMDSSDIGGLNMIVICQIMALEMMVFSFLGSELSDTSASIAREIYNIDWYDTPLTFQKKVLLISVRAQKTVGITAFKFYFSSVEKFGKTIQSTYSFYLVVKKIIAK
ncbi:uncharacterized protein LOC129748817 [Uranotaenia lowii]|uniref:uncharacterized protein LOC129748817 n=1 Tax=Uranotaenia lowii TaxID=190385 RepID=UPI0024792AD1|nr:uncharacterized protein LOC129748817 [Uranotaenia lowii]